MASSQVGHVMKLVDEAIPTYSFAWIVNHPDFCCDVVYKSKTFSTGTDEEREAWHLEFETQMSYTVPHTPQKVRFCGLELHLQSCTKPKMKKRVIFFYLDHKGKAHHPKVVEFLASPNMSYDLQPIYGNFQASSLTAISHEKLIICCKISDCIDANLVSTLIFNECGRINKSQHEILDDFEAMMKNGRLSDAVLNVSGEQFHVHKAILACRSPVFMATFESDMQEKQLSKIDIPDFKPEVIQELLRYIYTDKVENLDASAKDLIVAAEKYQIEGLKMICSSALANSLNEKNAIDILVLSDLHRAEDLKHRTYNFITAYVKNIQELEGYDSLKASPQSKNLLDALSAIESLRITH